jgi:hypothetical protein
LNSFDLKSRRESGSVSSLCKRGVRLGACGLASAWLALSVAAATVVPWMDLKEMAATADVIILGTIESVESGWSDDGRIIVTRATLSVERTFKGGPRASVVVETPGGKVGDLAMVASGAPVFHAGERVVLFLEPAGGPAGGARRHGVVGWNQGRMVVRRDPRTGRDLVEDRSAGTLYLDRQGKPVGPGRSGKGPAELQEFLRDVEHLVAETARGTAP